MEELIKYFKALIALQCTQLASRNGEMQVIKPEVVLARAGLKHQEIAAILGKKPSAVSMTVSRAKGT